MDLGVDMVLYKGFISGAIFENSLRDAYWTKCADFESSIQ